jgi:hypothetical protein
VPSRAPEVVVDPLSTRNRRTALILLAWIALLMLASAVVAWLRN